MSRSLAIYLECTICSSMNFKMSSRLNRRVAYRPPPRRIWGRKGCTRVQWFLTHEISTESMSATSRGVSRASEDFSTGFGGMSSSFGIIGLDLLVNWLDSQYLDLQHTGGPRHQVRIFMCARRIEIVSDGRRGLTLLLCIRRPQLSVNKGSTLCSTFSTKDENGEQSANNLQYGW
jgi:hypothetical protein